MLFAKLGLASQKVERSSMAKKQALASMGWVVAVLVCAILFYLPASGSAVGQQESQTSRPVRVKVRPADQPESKAQEQQASANEENIPPSSATLKTAKTIYIERMPHNLHLYVTAELNKQRAPYKVVLDKREADLWMVGIAEIYQKDAPSSKIREAGQVITDIFSVMNRESPPLQPDTKTVAAVYIVARGGKEVLWASQSSVFSALGSDQAYVAKRLVKDLRKSLVKAK